MPCPMCRKEFTIPDDGLSGMPKAHETSEALRSLVVGDKEKVTNVHTITEEVLQRLKNEQNDVIKHLAAVEDDINAEADKLIAAIQSDKVKLLSEVALIRLKRVKQLDTVRQKVKQHATELESFKSQSETLLSSGTDCDARKLHDRAEELMKFDVVGHVDSSLPEMRVNFTSSTLLDRQDENLVGTVTEGGQLRQLSSNSQGRLSA